MGKFSREIVGAYCEQRAKSQPDLEKLVRGATPENHNMASALNAHDLDMRAWKHGNASAYV